MPDGEAPSGELMVAAIKEYCRAENAQDRDAFFALFAEGVVHEDPVGYITRRGLGELEGLWEQVVASNVDLWLTEDVIARGNEAIAIMACETGPADARRKTGPIVDQFTFDDAGKIVGVRAFYNFG